jgi:hypothetical protein
MEHDKLYDMTTSEAFQAGFSDLETVAGTHRYDVKKALKAWTFSAFDHAETSYFGARYIQNMRAYWLGILARQRANNLGWHTFHAADNPGAFTL